MCNLIYYPNPILSKKAEPFKKKQKPPQKIINKMFQLIQEKGGLGLASPQIGYSKQLIVLVNPIDNTGICIYNPKITILDKEKEYMDEGCLSLPDIYLPIERYKKIHVEGFRENGENINFTAESILARIIQHEVDHLNGLTILDRVDILTRESAIKKLKESFFL